MKKKFYINGKFLTQRITGVQRVAIELTKHLDAIVEKGDFTIITPPGALIDLKLHNIETIVVGRRSGALWTQITLPKYARKNGGYIITFSGLCALLKPDYFFVHDVTFIRCPESFNKKFRYAYDFFFRMVLRRCRHIFTVSEFSKKEISNVYGTSYKRISVIHNASIMYDFDSEECDILSRLRIEANNYFFSVGSINIHKNQKYIFELAKKYPQEIFVIAGGRTPKTFNHVEKREQKNLIFAGYVSDKELYELYRNTKGFIFPSLYEGFGVPPLEAIFMGSKRIALSDIEVFREIYPVGCYYFNPYKVDDFSVEIFCSGEISKDEVTYYKEKYTWTNSSQKLLRLLND